MGRGLYIYGWEPLDHVDIDFEVFRTSTPAQTQRDTLTLTIDNDDRISRLRKRRRRPLAQPSLKLLPDTSTPAVPSKHTTKSPGSADFAPKCICCGLSKSSQTAPQIDSSFNTTRDEIAQAKQGACGYCKLILDAVSTYLSSKQGTPKVSFMIRKRPKMKVAEIFLQSRDTLLEVFEELQIVRLSGQWFGTGLLYCHPRVRMNGHDASPRSRTNIYCRRTTSPDARSV